MPDCFAVSTSKPAPAAACIRKALLDAVDYALLAGGQIVRATIYQRMEEQYHIRREEIPDKLDAFYGALQGMLGVSAEAIKRLITKNFYRSLDIRFTEQKNWTLVDYIHHATKASDARHLTS
jgi:hypothetical protein